jgi:hypothetical protein
MKYSTKLKHQKSKHYYSDLELKRMRKEHHGRFPSVREIIRAGTRRIYHIPEIEHKKGAVILYKGKYNIVTSVKPSGVVLQDLDSGKKTFIKEKRFEEKTFPYYVVIA